MMNSKVILGLAIGGVSLVTGGFAYFGKKMHNLAKKIGISIRDLSEAETKEIREDIIERSVEKAANKAVDRFSRDVDCRALSEMKAEIKAQVKASVEKAHSEISALVEKEISEQVAAIDHNSLKKKVTEEAKKKVLEKFDGNLDDILQDFQDDLNRVKKIHTSIADALDGSKEKGKGLTFTVGG